MHIKATKHELSGTLQRLCESLPNPNSAQRDELKTVVGYW